MAKKAFRHGEILFVKVDNIPEGLKLSRRKTILRGYSNNPHKYDNGRLYLRDVDKNIFGYFVADNTKLLHKEHGIKVRGHRMKVAKIPDGMYELRMQVEIINEEMRPIVD